MNRRPSSFRSLAAAAAGDTAAMPVRPYFRGGRRLGSRGFSDRPLDSSGGELVSGDSHFGAVLAANRSFRPSYNAVPPPPQYGSGQEFYGPGFHRPGHAVSPQLTGSRPRPPYRYQQQVGPGFGNYQSFRPQQMKPQFRPRPSKPPDYREWEYAVPGPPPNCERFTVLSYNILADYLATNHWSKLYFHIPHYIMDWNWRKRNLCFELRLWSADILCFQEVDKFQDLQAELNPRGYNGIWKMRTGDPADGCAMFWRVSRFKLVHEESIEYYKLALRDNVAQICVFESQNGLNNKTGISTQSTRSEGSTNRVVVCNTHVLFNPKRGDIKLGQIRLLLERAHAISKRWDDAPIVLCGDFNCTPKSPMYNFIKEQKLDFSGIPRDKISGQASAEIYPSRPPFPDYRKEAANDAIPTSEVGCDKPEQEGFPLDAQKLAGFHSSADSSSMADNSKSEFPDNQIKHSSLPDNHSSDLVRTVEPSVPYSSGRPKPEETSEKLSPDSLNVTFSAKVETVSAATNNHYKLSFESCSSESVNADILLGEKFEHLSVNELNDGARDELHEDSGTFLSELHSDDVILNDPLNVEDTAIVHDVNSLSSVSAWTPAEIQTATGNADCYVMEHPLKLKSAYTEVQSSLRDSTGEPLVTSYHRRFSGTVDYIWYSEGLQTKKVLAPIPKEAMHQSQGFPTKKWGSDHIALVAELAFTKGISSDRVTQ